MKSMLCLKEEDLSTVPLLSLCSEHTGGGGSRLLVGACFDGDDEPDDWPAWAYVRRMWNAISHEVTENENDV